MQVDIIQPRPQTTSRVIHVTVFCARKAIRAPGDEAGYNTYVHAMFVANVPYSKLQ